MMVIAMFEGGIAFDEADVEGLARTLTDNIWNGSLEDPRFHNYIDGANGPYRNLGPWEGGWINAGWAMLGRYSSQAQLVFEASLQAAAGGVRNPTIDRWDGHAKVALSGHVALAQASCDTSIEGRSSPSAVGESTYGSSADSGVLPD